MTFESQPPLHSLSPSESNAQTQPCEARQNTTSQNYSSHNRQLTVMLIVYRFWNLMFSDGILFCESSILIIANLVTPPTTLQIGT